jgi:hypothetical protein
MPTVNEAASPNRIVFETLVQATFTIFGEVAVNTTSGERIELLTQEAVDAFFEVTS